ncbi:MAG: tetratricopeptide repeat protein [Planctomycetota bacterium]|jgi:tetratricopeptide (TPR) repeat protein
MSSKKAEVARKPGIAGGRNWPVLAAAAVVVAATAAAYHNSFSGPLVLDDAPAIEENLSIHSLWPIWRVLSPPPRLTVTGRPIVNLSLAVNYAISGTEVWSYHVFNLVVHILVALTLFGVVRRTLLLPALRDRFERSAVFIALAVALIWAIHPLQTESVTYIIQRAESIAGLFYLLTLYCVIRGATAAGPAMWYVFAVVACLLGMATKEVMVSAPLIVLLYDRAFLAGSFKEALRRRLRVYAGLAATWGLLAYLIIGAEGRGGSVGFAGPVTAWSYLRAQFGWIIHYLSLCIWPHPLVLFYGDRPDPAAAADWLYAALVIGLLAGTVWAMWRRPRLGFVGAFFFAVLAPTSSFVPVQTQVAAEHRMYLALAAVVVLGVAGCWWLWPRWAPARGDGETPRAVSIAAAVAVLAIVAAALGVRTALRNEDYRSAMTLWEGVLKHRPDNHAAFNALGHEWDKLGKPHEAKALELFQRAVSLRPDYPVARIALGELYIRKGEWDKAIQHLEIAVLLDPGEPKAHFHFAVALAQKDQLERAVSHYLQSLRLAQCRRGKIHFCLAEALAKLRRFDLALKHYESALQEEPNNAEAHCRLGEVLAKTGRFKEAEGRFREALAIDPRHAKAHCNLGVVLAKMGRFREAREALDQALRIRPNYAHAHHNLGLILAMQDKMGEAHRHFLRAVQIRPDDPDTRHSLAEVLVALGRFGEAAAELDTLAAVHAKAGEFEQAVAIAERALEMAGSAGMAKLAREIEGRLKLYRSGRLHHEAAPAASSPR